MKRLVVPAFAVLAATFSFAVPAARADDAPGVPATEMADRLEREANALLAQGRCGEGARLMSKAWRLRAEAWGAEMNPERRPPMAPMPGGPGMPRPPGPRLDVRMPKFVFGGAERTKIESSIERMKAESNELEQAGKAAKAAGDEDGARAKMEASGRLWRKAEEMEKGLRERGEKREHAAREKREKADHERTGLADHNARMAEAHEKLARMEGEAAEWAAKAKELQANGHETAAAEAAAKAKEAAEKARHLKERLAAAQEDLRANPWKLLEPGAKDGPRDGVEPIRQEVRRLRAAFEEVKAQLEALRKKLDEAGR